MAEKTIKSVRANPEAFERLAAIAKEGGIDQGAALEALLNAWDVQAAKGQVPERAADVADFDAHLQGIQRAFLRSLELAQSAEGRARASLAAQIEARDATIIRLQAELAEKTEAVARWIDEAAKLTKERDELKEKLADAEKRERLASLLDALADRLDAPELPEASRKRGRKAKAEAVEAAAEASAE